MKFNKTLPQIFILALLTVLTFGSPAFAADNNLNYSYQTQEENIKSARGLGNMFLNPSGVLNLSVNRVLSKINQITVPLKSAATRLFWILCAISAVLSGIRLIFQDGTIQNFFGELVKMLLIIGIFEFLLQNGPDIGADIIDSMIKLSQSQELGISECADKTFKIAGLLINKAGAHGPIMEITIILEVVLIFVVLSLIIVKFAVMYVSAYFVCVAGIFVLGFGALSFTRDLSVNYLKMLFSIGLQLMSIILICSAGFSIFDDFIYDLETSGNISFTDTTVLIFTSLFIYGLSTGTPQVVGQLIMGANISGGASLLKPVALSTHIVRNTGTSLIRSITKSKKK
ncbi:P-type conjugative transfer protein TrbL [Succinatimonas hippei]|uniref:P-type conjugative transfer protein TrbL n=1 Tax=Succinatimonas hippei (strain DSM 22608 / JCM 16073 / KCTC 15190 / YIT 12066) TaxID=762983 RepID=E8LKH6_SUCHY|nr:P-type conjugative transfer protein TrbL [Succinatimonas hippei]EFY06963.1 P-type conjugative transfer protein TrbL [Succinatimonas hippei YIT 12066]